MCFFFFFLCDKHARPVTFNVWSMDKKSKLCCSSLSVNQEQNVEHNAVLSGDCLLTPLPMQMSPMRAGSSPTWLTTPVNAAESMSSGRVSCKRTTQVGLPLSQHNKNVKLKIGSRLSCDLSIECGTRSFQQSGVTNRWEFFLAERLFSTFVSRRIAK